MAGYVAAAYLFVTALVVVWLAILARRHRG
jgi:hypothetical protein